MVLDFYVKYRPRYGVTAEAMAADDDDDSGWLTVLIILAIIYYFMRMFSPSGIFSSMFSVALGPFGMLLGDGGGLGL